MASNSINVDAKEITSRITLKVKLRRYREFAIRTAIALLLIKMARWISWFSIEVIEDDN